jgi:hypothetical protein
MGEDRFNSLLLLYVHKDIELDIDNIIDRFATKNPRKMLLINPLLISSSKTNRTFHETTTDVVLLTLNDSVDLNITRKWPNHDNHYMCIKIYSACQEQVLSILQYLFYSK